VIDCSVLTPILSTPARRALVNLPASGYHIFVNERASGSGWAMEQDLCIYFISINS
jgi:hypothetical protein